jgi:hypothetical protein
MPYIVTAPGARLDADTVRGHVRERPARYAAPRDVHFRAHLPRNAMGKVVPRQLPETAGVAPPGRVQRCDVRVGLRVLRCGGSSDVCLLSWVSSGTLPGSG